MIMGRARKGKSFTNYLAGTYGCIHLLLMLSDSVENT